MPPFVNTKCVTCSKSNRFDLAELRKENNASARGILFRGEEKNDEQFIVTCQHCGKEFKFTLRGDNNGEEN